MPTKYLVASEIPQPARDRIIGLMRRVAHTTRRPTEQNRTKLPPHVTLAPPIVSVHRDILLAALRSLAAEVPLLDAHLRGITAFGKEFLVLPVRKTIYTEVFRSRVYRRLSALPGFMAGPYDSENILHVTLVSGLTPMFDQVWHRIQTIKTSEIAFTFSSVSLFEKHAGGSWKRLESYPLSP